MKWIPGRFASRWPIYFLVYTAGLTVVLWFIRFGWLGQSFEVGFAFRYLLLAAVLSAVANGIGWLGGRWFWLLFTLGLSGGLVAMAVYSSDRNGWGDLIGFAAFLQFIVFGLVAGLVGEAVAWAVRRRKRG